MDFILVRETGDKQVNINGMLGSDTSSGEVSGVKGELLGVVILDGVDRACQCLSALF